MGTDQGTIDTRTNRKTRMTRKGQQGHAERDAVGCAKPIRAMAVGIRTFCQMEGQRIGGSIPRAVTGRRHGESHHRFHQRQGA